MPLPLPRPIGAARVRHDDKDMQTREVPQHQAVRPPPGPRGNGSAFTPAVGDRRCPRAHAETLETWNRISRLVPAANIVAAVAICLITIPDPKMSRAAAIAVACLVLWLTECIPLYATTLVLWVATVLFLSPLDPKAFGLSRTLSVLSNPVMPLFFGGFVLAIAGTKYGIDTAIADWMVKLSFGRRRALLFTVMVGTAVLSMWISNIAAAAMMIATLRPLLQSESDVQFRRALLLGVAFAANFGGIGTPIGTGPNMIAIGSLADRHPISFVHWMLFGIPIAAFMITVAFLWFVFSYRVRGQASASNAHVKQLSPGGWWVVAIFCATVFAWLFEPLHGLPSSLMALLAACVLFATRLLDTRELALVRWNTLILIAGGLSLGELLNDSGLAVAASHLIDWQTLPSVAVIFGLVLSCALLSSVSSNTASTAIIIPIAVGISPDPTVAISVALGASMGAQFVISTPANSMAHGEGDLRGSDFLIPGTILLAVGCALVVLLASVIR